jgi:hypothetical protein
MVSGGRFSATTGLGIKGLDQPQQSTAGDNMIHLGEEPFATGLLALAGVFNVGKAHLAHAQLGSGGQAYYSILADLFGESLGQREDDQQRGSYHPFESSVGSLEKLELSWRAEAHAWLQLHQLADSSVQVGNYRANVPSLRVDIHSA